VRQQPRLGRREPLLAASGRHHPSLEVQLSVLEREAHRPKIPKNAFTKRSRKL
jgi:hypothetical protein